jgi:hypothetical protein
MNDMFCSTLQLMYLQHKSLISDPQTIQQYHIMLTLTKHIEITHAIMGQNSFIIFFRMKVIL